MKLNLKKNIMSKLSTSTINQILRTHGVSTWKRRTDPGMTQLSLVNSNITTDMTHTKVNSIINDIKLKFPHASINFVIESNMAKVHIKF